MPAVRPEPAPPIVTPDAAVIEAAAQRLAAGDLVGMPTETVYGLACHAMDAAAAAKVFASKGRPSFDPLIVHLGCSGAVFAWLDAPVPEAASALAEAFWPGPLTLVLPKPAGLPGIVTAGLDTVGVRVPAHPVAQKLIAALGDRVGGPGVVAAPSANPFGGVSPTRAEDVHVDCAMVLDGGPCATGVESTVVRPMADGSVAVLRPGGVSVEALAEVIGEHQVRVVQASADEKQASQGLASPGTTLKHYAPRTPMRLLRDRAELVRVLEAEPERCGVLGMRLGVLNGTAHALEDLSPTGDVVEAAANLFAAMHRLDAGGLSRILAEPVPEAGLGRAINDRLRRASR